MPLLNRVLRRLVRHWSGDSLTGADDEDKGEGKGKGALNITSKGELFLRDEDGVGTPSHVKSQQVSEMWGYNADHEQISQHQQQQQQ